MGVPDVFTGVSSGGLKVEEQDGVPTITNVNTIKVTNGALTDDGNGTISLDMTAGGGGVTTITFGSTGLTPSVATSGTVTVAGTLIVANGGTGATTLTDNSVLTGTGTSAITAEGNLTFDGTTLTATGFSCTGDANIGDAASDSIGFYDVSGVVQRTVANASSAAYAGGGGPGFPIDTLSTFGGYTLEKIVGALQDLGLLDV